MDWFTSFWNGKSKIGRDSNGKQVKITQSDVNKYPDFVKRLNIIEDRLKKEDYRSKNELNDLATQRENLISKLLTIDRLKKEAESSSSSSGGGSSSSSSSSSPPSILNFDGVDFSRDGGGGGSGISSTFNPPKYISAKRAENVWDGTINPNYVGYNDTTRQHYDQYTVPADEPYLRLVMPSSNTMVNRPYHSEYLDRMEHDLNKIGKKVRKK
jgi:hypothetical protein